MKVNRILIQSRCCSESWRQLSPEQTLIKTVDYNDKHYQCSQKWKCQWILGWKSWRREYKIASVSVHIKILSLINLRFIFRSLPQTFYPKLSSSKSDMLNQSRILSKTDAFQFIVVIKNQLVLKGLLLSWILRLYHPFRQHQTLCLPLDLNLKLLSQRQHCSFSLPI